MFDKAKDKATKISRSVEEANTRADDLLDPIAAKAVASRYTVVYVALASVFFFSAGFALGQYF